MNKMVIQDETPIYTVNENQHTLLRYAAMAAKWKGKLLHSLKYILYKICTLFCDNDD